MTVRAPGLVDFEKLSRTAQPTLSTKDGLLLRPFHADDAPDVLIAYTDPVTRQWHNRVVDTEHDARKLIEEWLHGWTAGTDALWAVIDGDTFAARIGLRRFNIRDASAEIGYWAMPTARGRGVVPRAVDAVTDWAFGEIGFHRIELNHSVHNPASCRVAEKTGFALEGVKRAAAMHADGWHDMHLHARVAP
ncbi:MULTISPECIES: GNAT family N-acetyltransferase [unclassified Nocardia]|uniref:GNAT family N-acetyltransferase n=1 Tax=unclassified Nocardia TaxID=2637762 RepID=UPI001CE40C6A|nr:MULTISPECIES: GNAT family N-acetyltransferase [unclassified Nocardia]